MNQGIIQSIGLIAFAFGAAGFSVKNRKTSILLLSFGSVVWTIHYFLLGSYITSCMTAAIGIRTLLSIRTETLRERHFLFYMSSAVFCGLAYFAWQGPASLLPLIASINAGHAFSYRNNIGARYQLLLSSACWIINGFIWHSYAHMLSESFIVCLNLRVIYLLHKGGERPGNAISTPVAGQDS